MSWLLFLDESGHDHKNAPYEVHGGFAIHARKLWPFISAVRTLEQSIFGADLREHGVEIKGSKLLKPRCFKWAAQGEAMEDAARRKHALTFLNDSRQGRPPRRDGFTAYGQACLALAEGVISLLASHDARAFAGIVPRHAKPLAGEQPEHLRKDQVFLLERFFYFLEREREAGLLVMDGTEKSADRRLVRCIERYFTRTLTGRGRTQWIVPVPLFVESDMAYGVQAADLCIYCLNWGHRLAGMTEATRPEVEPFARLVESFEWRGEGYRDGKVFKSRGTVYVPNLYD